jgi:hypothetical protein
MLSVKFPGVMTLKALVTLSGAEVLKALELIELFLGAEASEALELIELFLGAEASEALEAMHRSEAEALIFSGIEALGEIERLSAPLTRTLDISEWVYDLKCVVEEYTK